MTPPAKAASVAARGVHVDLDFTDQELHVREFADGMWTLEVDAHRLLVTTPQMQEVVGAFLRLGKEKGWT